MCVLFFFHNGAVCLLPILSGVIPSVATWDQCLPPSYNLALSAMTGLLRQVGEGSRQRERRRLRQRETERESERERDAEAEAEAEAEIPGSDSIMRCTLFKVYILKLGPATLPYNIGAYGLSELSLKF